MCHRSFSKITEKISDTTRLHFNHCNICIKDAKEPILTLCGHLFCWPCYYISEHGKIHTSCPKCQRKIFIYEFIVIYVTDEQERHDCITLNNVKIPPRTLYAKKLDPNQKYDLEKLRKLRNRQYKSHIIYYFFVTKNMLSFLMGLGMLFMVYLYSLKEMFLGENN